MEIQQFLNCCSRSSGIRLRAIFPSANTKYASKSQKNSRPKMLYIFHSVSNANIALFSIARANAWAYFTALSYISSMQSRRIFSIIRLLYEIHYVLCMNILNNCMPVSSRSVWWRDFLRDRMRHGANLDWNNNDIVLRIHQIQVMNLQL